MSVKKPFYIEFVTFNPSNGSSSFEKFGRDIEPTEDQVRKIMNKNPRYDHAQVYKRSESGVKLLAQYNR